MALFGWEALIVFIVTCFADTTAPEQRTSVEKKAELLAEVPIEPCIEDRLHTSGTDCKYFEQKIGEFEVFASHNLEVKLAQEYKCVPGKPANRENEKYCCKRPVSALSAHTVFLESALLQHKINAQMNCSTS